MIRMACGGIMGSTVSTPVSVCLSSRPADKHAKREEFSSCDCRIEPLVCGSLCACFGSIASAICLTLALLPGTLSDWGAPLTASSGMRSFSPLSLFLFKRCFVTQSIMYYFNHQLLAKHTTHGIAVPRGNSGKFIWSFLYIFGEDVFIRIYSGK